MDTTTYHRRRRVYHGRIMSCTADALAAMHEHVPNALLHRDVKADNVLLGDGMRRVVLADLGTAKQVSYSAVL